MQGRKPAGDRSPDSLFIHCEATYKAMLASAKGVVVFDEDKNENRTIVLWEGMLTQFITGEMKLSVPYYTYITRALKNMGCIRQIKRGGGTAPSQWELITEPTEEAFIAKAKVTPKGKHTDSSQALVQGQLSALNRRVNVLEQALAGVIEEETDNA